MNNLEHLKKDIARLEREFEEMNADDPRVESVLNELMKKRLSLTWIISFSSKETNNEQN